MPETDTPVAAGEPIGRVLSVNVGAPRVVEWHGRQVRTAIWKDPVEGPVEVGGVNLAGDDQADRRVHGGTHKAVYAYGAGDYSWWSGRLGVELAPGTFGDNLTLDGIELGEAWIGERWGVATCVLEVSEPRLPCFKLGVRMGTADFVELFDVVGRFGTYLRIRQAGTLAAGAAVVRLGRPEQRLTVAELAESRATDDPQLLERVMANPDVSASWVEGARRRLRRLDRPS